MKNLSAKESVKYIADNIEREDFVLLDVRTKEEVEHARIPNSIHIPLDQIGSRHNELDTTKELFVYCKGGTRSLQAIKILKEAGFTNLGNLDGGIMAFMQSGGKAVGTCCD